MPPPVCSRILCIWHAVLKTSNHAESVASVSLAAARVRTKQNVRKWQTGMLGWATRLCSVVKSTALPSLHKTALLSPTLATMILSCLIRATVAVEPAIRSSSSSSPVS